MPLRPYEILGGPTKAEWLRGQKKLPSLAKRAKNYAAAQAKHTAAGRPLSSQQTIDERLSICVTCPEYNATERACSKCGCNINSSRNAWKNKLAMANERCPLTPPKWGAEISELLTSPPTQSSRPPT